MRQLLFSHVRTEPPLPGYYQYFRGVKCFAQEHKTCDGASAFILAPLGAKKNYFYAPNFEKVGSILVSACLCVHPSIKKKLKLEFLNFIYGIVFQKQLIPYFFRSEVSTLVKLCPF